MNLTSHLYLKELLFIQVSHFHSSDKDLLVARDRVWVLGIQYGANQTSRIPCALYVCSGAEAEAAGWFQIISVNTRLLFVWGRRCCGSAGWGDPAGAGISAGGQEKRSRAWRWALACPVGGPEGRHAWLEHAMFSTSCVCAHSLKDGRFFISVSQTGSPVSWVDGTRGLRAGELRPALMELGEETCICPQTGGLPGAWASREGACVPPLCKAPHGLEDVGSHGTVRATGSGHSALTPC